ncbi:107_t:CDS:1, partial [Funneliformis geosporum]
SFVKVKRHSDDFYNDKADLLAKQGCQLTPLTLNITSIENNRFVLSFKKVFIESFEGSLYCFTIF